MALRADPLKVKRKRKTPNKGSRARFHVEASAAREDIAAQHAQMQREAATAAARAVRLPTEVEVAEWAHLAFELRRRGASYRTMTAAINAQLPAGVEKITQRFVVDMVARYVNALDTETREPVRLVKRLELDRLDSILWGKTGEDGLFARARGQDDRAVDTFLRVQERRLALQGIHVDKLTIEVQDGGARRDPITLLAELLRKRAAQAQARGELRDVNDPPAAPVVEAPAVVDVDPSEPA